MADTPTWFPDVFEEIGLVHRLKTAQEQYVRRYEDLSRTDPRTGTNGLVLLNKLARVGPQMAPYAVPMAAAGVDPETSQLPAYVYQEDARKRLAEIGPGPFAGLVRPLANQGSSNPRYRLQNALDAANAAGLIDRNGVLREPEATELTDPLRYAFEDIRGAAMGAGVNLPYTDRLGHQRELTYGPKPPGLVSAEGHQAHRRYETAYEPFTEFQANANQAGLYKLSQLTSDPLLLAAGEKYTNEMGYLVDPHSGSTTPSEFDDFLNTLARNSNFDPAFITKQGDAAFTYKNGKTYNIPEFAPPSDDEEGGGTGGFGGGVASGIRRRAERAVGGSEPDPSAAVREGPLSVASASPLDVSYEGARQVVQGLGIAANAPIQEATGYIRNVYAATTGQGKPDWRLNQSDLSVMLSDPDADPGSGFFVDPESEVAKQRQANERTRGQIAGHNVTLGRWAALGAGIEPGDSSYGLASGLVDFGWQVYGDPTTYLLSGLGKLRSARGVFQPELDGNEAVGAYHTFTRWVHGPTAKQALNSRWGDGIATRLADLTSPSDVLRQLNYKPDIDLAVRLANERDPNEIKNILLPELGTTFRKKAEVWRPWGEKLSAIADVPGESFNVHRSGRFSAVMPTNEVDILDKKNGFRTLESYGKMLRMPQEDLNRHTDAFLRSPDVEGAEDAIAEFMSGADGILGRAGVTNTKVRNGMVQRYIKDRRQARMWLNDDVSSGAPMMDGMVIGDEFLHTGTGTPGAHSPHEILRSTDGKIELPDFRTMRRLTSHPGLRVITTQHSIWKTGKMEGHLRYPIVAMEYLQEAIWKPVTLARAAWFLRVVGEEQLRIAATPNMDSAFSHPLSYIAYLMGAGGTDIHGNSFKNVQQFREAMFSRRGGLLDDAPNRVRSSMTRTHTYEKASAAYDLGYRNSWADAITRMHQDPISRYVAGHSVDDTMAFLTSGEGRVLRDNLAAITGIDVQRDDLLRVYLHRVSNNISALTGNNTELIDVIRTGKFRTQAGTRGLFRRTTFREAEHDTTLVKSGFVDHRFREQLDNYVDDYGPNEIVGELHDFDVDSPFFRLEAGRQRAVDWLMSNLMGKETNFLSRSPYFRQQYWHRVAELAPYVKGADREAMLARFSDEWGILRSSDEKFLPNRLFRKVEYEMRQATDEAATLSVDELDVLAKDYALQSTRDKLFDLTKKQSWEDSARLVSPFISAWKEVFTSWGKLIAENPSVPRRAFQIADGAIRSGVFYEDEMSGDLVFTYPGSEFMTKNLLGVPIPLTGRAEGLNFMAQVVPGIGPALQIPVSALMANKPQYREMYEFLVPYGSATEQGLGEGFDWLNYAPPYMKRFLQAMSAMSGSEGSSLFYNSPQDIRTYSNTVGQIARYLASTGEYDMESLEDRQRLIDDAKEKAARFYAVRSMASFFAPSAPAPKWLSDTKSGDLIPIAVLTEEYRRMQNENFEDADDQFLAKYGDEVVLSMTPFSKTLSWGLDPSQEFYDWTLENPELRRNYPSTFGLYGPTGKFDIGAFSAQFMGSNPDREQLSVEEWMQFAEHMMASRIYEKERNFAGNDVNTDEWSNYLATVRAELRQQYPGYNNARGLPGGVEVEPAIAEVQRAVEDPKLRDNPVAKAARTYLTERQAGLDDLANDGLRGFKSERATEWRQYLQSVAFDLYQKTPEFERMYDMVFSRELEPGGN